MSNANSNSAEQNSMNKMIGMAMAAFAVVEAIVTFFVVMNPLFVKPVYAQRDSYIESGVTCTIKMFGKTFASETDIANNQVILSFWDTIMNIALLYIIATGILLVLAFCFYKGFAFAKSYLTAVFAAKGLIGLIPIIVPFANIRNSMRIYGAIDAIICFAACIYFVYINSVQYADEMLFTDDERAAMKKRGTISLVTFIVSTAVVIFSSFGMGALGGNWSIFLGWLSDTQIAQGAVLAVILAVAIVASILYVREGDWAVFFFFSFGVTAAVVDLLGLIMRFTAGEAKTATWWRNTVFLALAMIAGAALAVYSFANLKDKFSLKFEQNDKKPAIAVYISVCSILANFVLTIIAVALWDGIQYNPITLGAMDFMYFLLYGGITLFLAFAMLGGYSFTKFGTLALFIIVASNNFSSIFTVFSSRSAVVQSYASQGMSYTGVNYIIAGIMYILATISCLGIISVFVVKDVDNYMYQKRYC